jgi:hypothetical protein
VLTQLHLLLRARHVGHLHAQASLDSLNRIARIVDFFFRQDVRGDVGAIALLARGIEQCVGLRGLRLGAHQPGARDLERNLLALAAQLDDRLAFFDDVALFDKNAIDDAGALALDDRLIVSADDADDGGGRLFRGNGGSGRHHRRDDDCETKRAHFVPAAARGASASG